MKKKLLYLIALLLFDSIICLSQSNMYDAIVVGENVRLREKPNLQCKTIAAMNTGQLLNIIDETDERESIGSSGNSCAEYGYKWYEVKTSEGMTGWVFGMFLYKISNNDPHPSWVASKENISSSFDLNGKSYNFGIAYDVSYPPDDSLGLTGCDDLYLPYFYYRGKKSVYPLRYLGKSDNWAAKLWSTDDKNWLLLMSGEGGSDDFETITSHGTYLKAKIVRGFQDGGAEITLKIQFNGTYFTAEEIEFIDMTPNYDEY